MTLLIISERPRMPPPAAVTPLQARRALRRASDPVSSGGLAWAATLDLPAEVAAFVAADPTGDAAEAWEYAVSIERADGVLIDAASGLGLTSSQIDDLFRLAATL